MQRMISTVLEVGYAGEKAGAEEDSLDGVHEQSEGICRRPTHPVFIAEGHPARKAIMIAFVQKLKEKIQHSDWTTVSVAYAEKVIVMVVRRSHAAENSRSRKVLRP